MKVASDYGRVQREESCVIPAYADQCVRPWLGGEGAEEGEPMSMHHSPAREVDEAVEEKKKEKHEKGLNLWDLLSLKGNVGSPEQVSSISIPSESYEQERKSRHVPSKPG